MTAEKIRDFFETLKSYLPCDYYEELQEDEEFLLKEAGKENYPVRAYLYGIADRFYFDEGLLGEEEYRTLTKKIEQIEENFPVHYSHSELIRWKVEGESCE
jgi:hypothetical protein